MKSRNLFLTTAFAMLATVAFAQVEIPEVKPQADSLQMSVDTLLLESFTITAERPLFSVEGEKTLYQVSDDPTVQSGVASDALQNAPGVSVDVEGNITLRGASSVEIWINDLPSNLTGESLKTYIQTLPANAIDRIEVITNPSARYATTADGIINIVMNAKIKRNEFLCFGVNASSQPYVMPWASYIWKNDKWTVNAYTNTYLYHSRSEAHSEKDLFGEDEVGNQVLTSHLSSSMNTRANIYSPGLNLNITYMPNKMNTVSFYTYFWDSFGTTDVRQERERIEYLNQSGEYKYSILNKSKHNFLYLPLGLNYQHKFNEEGHNLTFRLNCSINRTVLPIDYHKTYTLPTPYERAFVMDYVTSNTPINGNVDYNLPYSKNGEFGMGVNAGWEVKNENAPVDSLAHGEYVHDSMMSYRFQQVDHNLGAYFQVRHRFGNFTVQPTVSFRYYRTGIAYPDAPEYDSTRYYCYVLPSLHLSYRTKSMHNLKLSYSMKIQNPYAEQLSPFIKYDEESYSTGNPHLKQVFTHNLEASWTKYWDDFGSIGLTGYYKGKRNEINTITDAAYLDYYGRVVSDFWPVNVGKSYNAGGEFNMMYRPNGMFNLRFYANLYDSYIETHYEKDDLWEQNAMLCYSFRLSLWAKLWDRLEVHASAYYNSPTQTLFWKKGAEYSIDCGLRADFFDHKLSVFVNGYDLFGLLKRDTYVNGPSVTLSETSRYNSTCVCAGFTLRFGNIELEHEAQNGGEAAGQ